MLQVLMLTLGACMRVTVVVLCVCVCVCVCLCLSIRLSFRIVVKGGL